ncbi:MAG: hypothetical protein GY945_02620 [Rhodobacteraceae bacterium]|nr:hypothetical protein [Paracoccaceae bacterium]
MRFSFGFFTAVAFFLHSQAAFACACCADPGERFTRSFTPDAYALEEFARLENEGPAQLFLTACGEDCVRGISEISFDYNVDWHLENHLLRVVTHDPAGTIAVSLGDNVTRFSVDTAPMSHAMNTPLYTEFRFNGEIHADGIFANADGAVGDLVLAGETNHCWSADALSHWILQVSGEGADFRLFGGLAAR